MDETLICKECGKKFEMPVLDENSNVSELIIKQKELCLCDKCFADWFDKKEE